MTRPTIWLERLVALTAIGLACSPLQAPSDPGESAECVDTLVAYAPPKIDVVVVVDDSPAMVGFADAAGKGLQTFGNVFRSLPSDASSASVRALVVRASAPFPALTTPACGVTDDRPFASRECRDRRSDFYADARLPDQLSCAGRNAGASGGPARLFDAFRAAVDPSLGFLRPDSLLAIVFITAGDIEQSDSLIQTYADWLRGAHGSHRSTLSVIAGPPLAGCTTLGGATAAPAQQLKLLTAAFGRQASFTSICADHWSPAADVIAHQFGTRDDWPCLSGRVGPMPRCVVEETTYDDSRRAVSTASLPNCDDGAAPCWRLVPDPRTCEVSGIAPRIDGGDRCLVERTWTFRCACEP